MRVELLLNFIKWQIKNRLPGGGTYQRSFGKREELDENSIEHFLYLNDLCKNNAKKYLFGSCFLDDNKINNFYRYLDDEFKKDELEYYEFILPTGEMIKLPIPMDEDKNTYRVELFDLILPYLIGYPKNLDLPFYEGPYEFRDVKVKPDTNVLDLGANFGMFSAYASAKGCNVFAFEPTKDTINNYLVKTKELNKNIAICDLAVSNVSGIQEFIIDKNDASCNRFLTTKTNLLKHEEKKIYVPTTTIDDFVITNNLSSVDFIKADIEGAERLMLKGAKETLKEFEPDLAICYYHKLDDYKVLTKLILDANPNYEINHAWKKIYAHSKRKG